MLLRHIFEETTLFTTLTQSQIDSLVDVMREMIDSDASKTPAEAAGLALENIAGFDTASPSVFQDAIKQLVAAYGTSSGGEGNAAE